MLTLSMENYQFLSAFLLIFSCALMLAGFSLRRRFVGPWLMLVGICCALAIIGVNILRMTGRITI